MPGEPYCVARALSPRPRGDRWRSLRSLRPRSRQRLGGGGLVLHPVPTETDGRLSLDNLRSAIRDKSDYQCAPPGVIVLENPHCQRGGRVLPESYIKEVRELAEEHGLPLHLDGARIFNAAIASKRSPAEMAKEFDSIMFSLSKGLAAPFGSMVCGTRPFIDRVRRYRKLLGGGLRQAGFMASAGTVALQTMVDRLIEDHRRAQLLAEKIREIPGCQSPRNRDPGFSRKRGSDSISLQVQGDVAQFSRGNQRDGTEIWVDETGAGGVARRACRNQHGLCIS
ncbi:threonine aldolase family protein [Mesorhizobium sp. M0051]